MLHSGKSSGRTSMPPQRQRVALRGDLSDSKPRWELGPVMVPLISSILSESPCGSGIERICTPTIRSTARLIMLWAAGFTQNGRRTGHQRRCDRLFTGLLNHPDDCSCGECRWVQEAKPDMVIRAACYWRRHQSRCARRFLGSA